MDLPNPYPERDGCQINVVTRINPRVTFGSYPQKGLRPIGAYAPEGINSLLMGPAEQVQLIQPHLYATTG
jgi:hypothetical protein